MPSLSLPSKDPGLRARLAPHPRPPRLWGLAPQCPGGSSKQVLRKKEAVYPVLTRVGDPPSQPGQSRRVRRARTRTRAGHTASPWAEVVTGARQTPVGMCHAERTRTITATDARAISLSADSGFPIDPNWQLTLTAAGHGHRGDENLLALPQ